uniref:Putative secreted protein n=1 Tax=Ixodes ricinus TaxID=34613 RepID=A0A6B0UGS9_IXORI
MVSCLFYFLFSVSRKLIPFSQCSSCRACSSFVLAFRTVSNHHVQLPTSSTFDSNTALLCSFQEHVLWLQRQLKCLPWNNLWNGCLRSHQLFYSHFKHLSFCI